MDEIKNTYKSIDVHKSKSDPDNKDNCDAICAKCESNAVLNAGASTLKHTPSEHGQGLKVNQGITDMEKQSDAILIKDDSKKNLTKPGQDNTISSHTTNVKNQSKSTLSEHDSKTLESKPSQNDTTIGSDIRYNVKKQSYIVLNSNETKKSVSKSAKDDKEESDTRNVKKQSDLIPNIESEPKKGDKVDSDETNMKNQSDVVLNSDDDCNTCEKCQPHAVLNAGNSIVKSAESEPAQGHKVDQDATDVKRQSDIIMNADKSGKIKIKPDQDDKLDSAILKNLEKSEVKKETVEKDREKIEVKNKDNDDAKSEEKVREKVEFKREEKDGYKTETKSEKKYEDKDDVKSEEKSKEKVASKTAPNKNLDTPDVKKVILDDIYKDEKISTDLEKKKPRKRRCFKCLKYFSETFKMLKKTDEQEYEGIYKEEKNKEIDKEKYLKETKNIVGIEDNEWFIQQYEKHIGNRKIKPIDPDILIKDLEMKAMKQYIPESISYRPKKSEKPEDSLFLSWKGPVVPKCVCPYRECFCRGDTNFLKEKSTSYFSRVIKKEFKLWNLGTLGVCFQSKKADAKALYNKVQERLALEQKYYKKVERKHKLHKLNPEFCFQKCYHCVNPNERNLRTTQFLPLFMYEKQVEEGDEDGDFDETESEAEEDDRICNVYDNTCGVSTQTYPIGDDGNFILPEWLKNKVVFPSVQNSIFSNLEGSKIEINPYKELKKDDLDDRIDVYAQKMEGFSFKNIKSGLSKLLSSILEIKGSGVPINTRYTQLPCRGVVCDDSDTCFTGYSFKHNGSRDYICGAVDYDFLPEIPYTEHLSISDIRKAYEQRDDDPCPCCGMYDRNRSRQAYEECIAQKGLIITPTKNVCEKLPKVTQKASETDSNEKQNVLVHYFSHLDERNKSQDTDGGIKNKENRSKPSTSKNEAKDGSYEIMNKVHFNIPNTISETEPQKHLDVNNSISSNIKVKPSPTPKSSPRTLEERCDFLNTTNVINQLTGSQNSVKLSVNNMQLKSGSDIKKVPLNIIADDKTSQSTFAIPSDALNPTIVAKTMGSGDTLDTISPSLSNNAKGESSLNTPSVLSSIFNWIFNPKASLFNRPKISTIKLRDNTPSKDLKISSKDRKTSSKDLEIIPKENTVEGEKVAKKASDVSEKEVFSLQYSTTQSVSSASSTRKIQSDMS